MIRSFKMEPWGIMLLDAFKCVLFVDNMVHVFSFCLDALLSTVFKHINVIFTDIQILHLNQGSCE